MKYVMHDHTLSLTHDIEADSPIEAMATACALCRLVWVDDPALLAARITSMKTVEGAEEMWRVEAEFDGCHQAYTLHSLRHVAS